MNEKCEDTIDEEKKDFFETARRLVELDYESRAEDDEYRDPLSIEVTDCIRVVLCTGGPHEEFQVYFDITNREFTKADYVTMNWGDRAERRLTDSERDTLIALYDLELFADQFYPERESRNEWY